MHPALISLEPARMRVHFIHVGKAGGTAIKYALRPFSTSGLHQIYLHGGHHFRLSHLPSGEAAFFILRDPVSRFVSGFFSRQRQGLPRAFFPWSIGEQAAFSRFITPNQLALGLTSTDEELKREAINAMRCIMHVNMPYKVFFGSTPHFLSRLADILFVGFQESLRFDFVRLRVILGLPDAVKLPEDEVYAHKNPIHLDRTLSPEAIENLRDWYREDYEFIELCRKHVPPERLGGVRASNKKIF
jgi:hypothetical protein